MKRNIKININQGQWVKNFKGDNYIPFPDTRPLTQRLGKRIKPNQEPDAMQVLLFDNSQRNCTGYIPSQSEKSTNH